MQHAVRACFGHSARRDAIILHGIASTPRRSGCYGLRDRQRLPESDVSDPNTPKNDTAGRPLPKRFYKVATVAARDGVFALELDGRAARTPLKRPLTVGARELGNALAAEWSAQTDFIDPARMPLTRLVTTAIDAVAVREADVCADIVKYAGSDLLCYRTEGPQALVARQAAAWDPVLAWARQAFGMVFVVTQGLVHVAQPPQTSAILSDILKAYPALPVAALHTLTTMTGSALLALAVAHGHLSFDAAWAAAHVDEDWQIEQWGSDAEAASRRAYRYRDAAMAALVLQVHRLG
jgi:chaperone required for assembly of F1-ATPase